jgi:hypothetical protein
MKTASISPEVFDLLERAVRAASSVSQLYAIGGAVGMAACGYARQTSDVDLFVDESARAGVLRALRSEDLHVQPVFEGLHYVAQRPGAADPELRVDVLVPYDDPDWSAVNAPDRGELNGLEFNVFPPELLVLSKFYGVDNPQYLADIYKMYHRAAFDAALARDYLSKMDPDKLGEWDAMIADFDRPREPSRKPKRRPR